MPDSSALVRICIPTYNAAAHFRKTLDSIVNQSHRNLEIVVVDNASKDDTVAIARSFQDPRITILEHTENVPAEENFTRCIKLSSGDYTAIYHADDVYSSEMVEQQVAFLEENADAGAVFVNANLIDEEGRSIGRYGLPERSKTADNLYDFQSTFRLVLRHSNFFICPSALARSHVYADHIREWRGAEFKTSADLDVWFRILQICKIGILPQRLIDYRISRSQGSLALRSRVHRADLFLVLDHYLALPEVQACLTHADHRYAERLARTDRIIRAVNFYLADEPAQARALTRGILSIDAVRAAFRDYRGASTFIAGTTIQCFTALGWHSLGKTLVANMKQLAGK